MNAASLQSVSNSFRVSYLEMVRGSREALIPSCFSIIDFVTCLYQRKSAFASELDLLISKGHAASVIYPFLAQIYNIELNYGADGSPYGIYANPDVPTICMPSGSLGHGLGVAAGYHMVKDPSYMSYVILGDGECFEGSIWEALMFISSSRLNHVIPVVDSNNRTILGDIDKNYQHFDISKKLTGFGFDVYDLNGHDFSSIQATLDIIESGRGVRPSAIVLKTIKGKGVPLLESSHLWHNRMPEDSVIADAISKLSEN